METTTDNFKIGQQVRCKIEGENKEGVLGIKFCRWMIKISNYEAYYLTIKNSSTVIQQHITDIELLSEEASINSNVDQTP